MTPNPNLRIKKLDKNAKLPTYATPGSAGADIYSLEDVFLRPGEWKAVSTGLAFAIPYGYEVQIRPRSGLALKQGLTVLNAPGTIDSDYRGEVKVLLINHGPPVAIHPGDRIAQMVLSKIEMPAMTVVEELDETVRGEGGFGSTGTK